MRKRHNAIGLVRAIALGATASLMLAGCATLNAADRSNIEGNWLLVAGSDARGDFELLDRTVTLTIGNDEAGKGSVSGTAACNTYFGSIEGAPESLTIGALGQTEMACFDGDDPNDTDDTDDTGSSIMELESRYLDALASVTVGVPGSGVGLILTGPDVSLSFVPTPAG